MKKTGILIGMLLLVAMLAAACVPQTSVTTPVATSATTPNASGNNQPSNSTANQANTSQQNLEVLSSMLGHEVQGLSGQSFGQVSGVVMSMAQSNGVSVPSVQYVIVTAGPGANASLSGKTFYVPMSAFKTASNGLVLNVDPAVLAKAPSFVQGSLPAVTTADWDKQIAAFWASQGMSLPVTGANAATASVMINNAINNLSLVDLNGQTLGQVKDFIIDPATGQVKFALIQTAANLGSKFVPVPMSVIQWNLSQGAQALGQMKLQVPASVLQTAPSFVDMKTLLPALDTLNQQVMDFWNSVNKK